MGNQCCGRRKENRAVFAKGGAGLSLAQLPEREQLPITYSTSERGREQQEKKASKSLN